MKLSKKYYYRILILIIVFVLFFIFKQQGDRTDVEMFKVADKLYKFTLFELAIDSELFPILTIENHENGTKSYRWIVKGTENDPVGMEIVVHRKAGTEPEMTRFGRERWGQLAGSERRRKKELK